MTQAVSVRGTYLPLVTPTKHAVPDGKQNLDNQESRGDLVWMKLNWMCFVFRICAHATGTESFQRQLIQYPSSCFVGLVAPINVVKGSTTSTNSFSLDWEYPLATFVGGYEFEVQPPDNAVCRLSLLRIPEH